MLIGDELKVIIKLHTVFYKQKWHMTESQTSLRRTEAKILVSWFLWYKFSVFCSSVSLLLEFCLRFMTCHNHEADRDEYILLKVMLFGGEYTNVFSYVNLNGWTIYRWLLHIWYTRWTNCFPFKYKITIVLICN